MVPFSRPTPKLATIPSRLTVIRRRLWSGFEYAGKSLRRVLRLPFENADFAAFPQVVFGRGIIANSPGGRPPNPGPGVTPLKAKTGTEDIPLLSHATGDLTIRSWWLR